MRRSTFALTALLAATPAHAEFDPGGAVGVYLDRVAAAARVEIAGVCASACTAKLGARDVCVRADAKLLFHAARDADGRVDALANLMLLQVYPRAIRAWAIRRGALDTERLTALSGREAIALGVRDCARDAAR